MTLVPALIIGPIVLILGIINVYYRKSLEEIDASWLLYPNGNLVYGVIKIILGIAITLIGIMIR